jgi:serine/threonine protein kinase
MKGRFLNLYDFSYRIENDMWSLGVIAFTLLSGMAPFDG